MWQCQNITKGIQASWVNMLKSLSLYKLYYYILYNNILGCTWTICADFAKPHRVHFLCSAIKKMADIATINQKHCYAIVNQQFQVVGTSPNCSSFAFVLLQISSAHFYSHWSAASSASEILSHRSKARKDILTTSFRTTTVRGIVCSVSLFSSHLCDCARVS